MLPFWENVDEKRNGKKENKRRFVYSSSRRFSLLLMISRMTGKLEESILLRLKLNSVKFTKEAGTYTMRRDNENGGKEREDEKEEKKKTKKRADLICWELR